MCRREDIQTRIMSNVVETFTGYMVDGVPSACHIWQGPDSGNGRGGGYPRMSLDGQTVAVHNRLIHEQERFRSWKETDRP